jgi:hypothetical protein
MRTLDFNAIVRLNSCLFSLRENGEARLLNSTAELEIEEGYSSSLRKA